MKQLTQEVFNRSDCPEWAMSASVDSFGIAVWWSVQKSELITTWGDHKNLDAKCELIGYGYDTTDWQNSAIDREVR